MKKLLFLLISPFFILAQTPCLDDVANATGLIGEFIPQCEEDGSYSPVQCWSSTGYCWCVDENGIEIPGTSLGPGQGVPNCGEIEGCTDPLACNYEPIATENNNSCEYCTCVDNVLISVNEKNYCLLTEAENNTIVYDYNWWQNNGFIFPDISGGTPSLDCNGDCPYNFVWTTIDGDLISTNGYLTNSDIMELGDYFLTVSDVNGCSSSMEFSILELNGDCINLTSFIETPTINRSLITTIDILGRETTNKGFQLHIYDDGSVEKSYKVE